MAVVVADIADFEDIADTVDSVDIVGSGDTVGIAEEGDGTVDMAGLGIAEIAAGIEDLEDIADTVVADWNYSYLACLAGRKYSH